MQEWWPLSIGNAQKAIQGWVKLSVKVHGLLAALAAFAIIAGGFQPSDTAVQKEYVHLAYGSMSGEQCCSSCSRGVL